MAIIISGLSNDILVNGSSVVTEAEAIGLAPTTSPTFTGTVTLPSTTSIGAVSSTELGYLDGVTSNIQTQLDAKLIASAMSLSANGYLKLSNGLIIQWGTTPAVSLSSSLTVTLPLTFPTACLNAGATRNGAYVPGVTESAWSVEIVSTSQIKVEKGQNSGGTGTATPFFYYAIGY